jgi:mannose-6-phosphate isomerase-like protein (cupin superfamily)
LLAFHSFHYYYFKESEDFIMTTITPWDLPGSPTEALIREKYVANGLHPYKWSNGPHDVYSTHTHDYNKIIYVVEGSILFGLPDENREVLLSAGDRLDLPANTAHNATVGPNGVICLEAHH